MNLVGYRQVRTTLRWMAQKDDLGQDMILLGGYGPLRRWIAMRYCELRAREVTPCASVTLPRSGAQVEYIALTADTTEADLKQRREIAPGLRVLPTHCI